MIKQVVIGVIFGLILAWFLASPSHEIQTKSNSTNATEQVQK